MSKIYDCELIKRNFIPKEDLKHFLVFENVYQVGDSIHVAYRAPFSEKIIIKYDTYLATVREDKINEIISI